MSSGGSICDNRLGGSNRRHPLRRTLPTRGHPRPVALRAIAGRDALSALSRSVKLPSGYSLGFFGSLRLNILPWRSTYHGMSPSQGCFGASSAGAGWRNEWMR
jgi:hypothetical protein